MEERLKLAQVRNRRTQMASEQECMAFRRCLLRLVGERCLLRRCIIIIRAVRLNCCRVQLQPNDLQANLASHPGRRSIVHHKPTHLVFESRPEATAHITAATSVLQDQPTQSLVHTAGICRSGSVILVRYAVNLCRAPRRVDTRRATVDRASGFYPCLY